MSPDSFAFLQHGARFYQNYAAMQASVRTFTARDVIPNPNFNDYIADHEKVVEHFSKRGSKLKSKTDVSATAAHGGSNGTTVVHGKRASTRKGAKNEDVVKSAGKASPSKSMSGAKAKPDIDVVILDRRRQSSNDVDSNPNIVVLHKRGSSTVSHKSLDALIAAGAGDSSTAGVQRKMSQLSLDDAASVHSAPGGRAEHGGATSGSHRSLDSCLEGATRGRSDSEASARQASVQATQIVAASANCDASKIKHTPIKMIPSLPVNTPLTRQINEQTGVAGTLQRHTLRRMKKSVSNEKDFDDVYDLPPPPIELQAASLPTIPSPLQSPALPPPPVDDMLQADNNHSSNNGYDPHTYSEIPTAEQMYEVIKPHGLGPDRAIQSQPRRELQPPQQHYTPDSATSPSKQPSPGKQPPTVARKPTVDERYDASGYMTVTSAAALTPAPAPSDSQPLQAHAAVSYNTGTIKKAPPTLPKGGASLSKAPPTLPKRKPQPAEQTKTHVRDIQYAAPLPKHAHTAEPMHNIDSNESINTSSSSRTYASNYAAAYRVPSIDASARSAYYGTNIRGFVTDLSRVVQEKHSALRQPLPPPQQQQQSTNTVRMAAPQPPPPRRPGTEPAFVPEDLPPPPAELLEELNTLRRKHSRQPPPPPKRQLVQVTTSS